eukprot:GHVR01180797.1.p1 GENE.GHVR01180797.1~~GHVR01180797.1.p1  ORF type:complete len:315 (+),score=59.07 GHVR01180797.1:30-947(+)
MYDRGGANVTQSLVHLHRRFLLMFWVSIFSLIFIIWYGFIYAQPYTDCDRDLVKWMKVQVIFSSIRVVLKIGILSSLASLLERSITTHAGEATTQVIRGWHFNAHRVVFFIESFWFVFGIQHALDEDECRDANPNVYSVVVGFMFAAAAFAFIRSHQSIVSCAVKFQTQRFTIPSNQDNVRQRPPHVSKAAVDRMMKFQWHVLTPQGAMPWVVFEDKEEITCCICLCDFEYEDWVRVLPCSHSFHTRCIDEWLNIHNTCPLRCKYDLETGLAIEEPLIPTPTPQTHTHTHTQYPSLYYLVQQHDH